jgi:hypothetical protein
MVYARLRTFGIVSGSFQQRLKSRVARPGNNLNMLMVQRSSGILATVEDDRVLVPESGQGKPSSVEIVSVQKLILRFEFDGV